MTEAEWLGDKFVSQFHVCGLLRMGTMQRTKAGKRRLRLFACACCRLMFQLDEIPAVLAAVDATERFAEGEIARAELDALLTGVADLAHGSVDPGLDAQGAARMALHAAGNSASEAAFNMTALPVSLSGPQPRWITEDAAIRRLLREVFGNPFRPLSLERHLRTRAILSVAQAAYDERLLPSGHLDSARLAVLSDALEDAGCADVDILSHLRSSGPHVRGCWALDLILGKQ